MFHFRKKQKPQSKITEESVQQLIHKELDGYIKRDEVQDYLRKINSDKERKAIWNGLSDTKRLQVLKYLERKRGIGNEHKK